MVNDALKIIRTLAADHLSTKGDTQNDHVWELNTRGDPPAFALCTTYGLRCAGMRIFPQFAMHGATLTDPASFTRPPVIEERYGNFLILTFSPFKQVDVQLEYWVPSSQVLAGRFRLTNSSAAAITISVAWAVILNPLEGGETMIGAQMGVNSVLKGNSDGVFPVFFLTGGPEVQRQAYPALETRVTLGAGSSRRLSWALASLDSVEASFSLARQTTSLQWEVEAVRTKMQARNTVIEFKSEKAHLDDLLHETQVKAHQLITFTAPPGKKLTFLTRRKADTRNFSPASRREELISFSQITSYDAWMLSRVLLPADPEPLKEIIESFIDYQQPDGSIPWALSKKGTASTAMTPPMLAGIACDVYETAKDQTWLNAVFTPLLRAFQVWFNRTPNMHPTWDEPAQCGIDNHPLYSAEKPHGLGLLPGMIHNPALDALLYKECVSLIKIADSLDETEHAGWLHKTAEKLAWALNSCWDENRATFTYRDIRSGLNHTAETIHAFGRNGAIQLKRNFKAPRRLTLFSEAQASSGKIISVTLTGKNGERDLTEELDIRPGTTCRQINSTRLFTRLETVEITGLQPKQRLSLGLAGNDAEDISLLLPIWCGAVENDRRTSIIEKTLIPRYLTPNGLTTYPSDRVSIENNSLSPFWNYLIIEGLLSSNRRDAAAKVLSAILDTQAERWQLSGYVSSLVNAASLQSEGELDTLSGLPAIWPLLKTLGIGGFTENEIVLQGLNEFFAPINVQYKKAILKLQADRTIVETVNGKQMEIIERTSWKVLLP